MAALFYFERERRTLASANLSDDKTLAHLRRVRSGPGIAQLAWQDLKRSFCGACSPKAFRAAALQRGIKLTRSLPNPWARSQSATRPALAEPARTRSTISPHRPR